MPGWVRWTLNPQSTRVGRAIRRSERTWQQNHATRVSFTLPRGPDGYRQRSATSAAGNANGRHRTVKTAEESSWPRGLHSSGQRATGNAQPFVPASRLGCAWCDGAKMGVGRRGFFWVWPAYRDSVLWSAVRFGLQAPRGTGGGAETVAKLLRSRCGPMGLATWRGRPHGWGFLLLATYGGLYMGCASRTVLEDSRPAMSLLPLHLGKRLPRQLTVVVRQFLQVVASVRHCRMAA